MPAEILVTLELTTDMAENQDEDLLEGIRNIQEFNKEFMLKSKGLYDSFINCDWHTLHKFHSKIQDDKSPQTKMFIKLPSYHVNCILFIFIF